MFIKQSILSNNKSNLLTSQITKHTTYSGEGEAVHGTRIHTSCLRNAMINKKENHHDNIMMLTILKSNHNK
jgi:hypothetical protein